MNITPNIINHEFIGTEAKVAKSRHNDYVGMSGIVVDETKKTFTFLDQGKRKIVVKESAVFDFELSDGTIVEIEGKLLTGRPEDRLKKQIRRLW